MVLIIAAAVLGAAVGLFVQRRLFAIAIALSLSGAAHLALGFAGLVAAETPGGEALAAALARITPADAQGIWPVMAAAGSGAILAAVLWSLVRRQSTDSFWFQTGGDDRRRGLRAKTMVEDRAIHEEARRRMDTLLDH